MPNIQPSFVYIIYSICLLGPREPKREFNTYFYPFFARSGSRGHNKHMQPCCRVYLTLSGAICVHFFNCYVDHICDRFA